MSSKRIAMRKTGSRRASFDRRWNSKQAVELLGVERLGDGSEGDAVDHRGVEALDEVDREMVARIVDVAHLAGTLGRGLGEFRIGFERRGIRIHPVERVAIALDEARRRVLAVLEEAGIGDDQADRLVLER